MLVNFPEVTPFDGVDTVGFALSTNDPNSIQNHIAILYKFDSDEPKLLHLAWHEDLRTEQTPNNKYIWIDLGEQFTEIDKQIILAHVFKIVEANGSAVIPYGFDSKGQYIDLETGKFKPSLKAVGLTCATFVLQVFKSCGFELVNLDSWQKKDKKAIRWQKEMLKTLVEREGVSKEFLEHQTANIGSRRYLPEEVAAASHEDIPASKGKLKENGKKLRDALKKNYRSQN